jgi:acetyl esterase/lipase
MFGLATQRSAYSKIIKTVADGRSSVRWFILDAAGNNTYRIDTRRIFFGGNSAGAILSEQLGFIDSAAACAPLLRKVVNKYLPDSAALPPHALRGVISLAGGVLDTDLIHSGAPPILHIQGDADNIVPYGYKRPAGGIAPFMLAGLGASRPRYFSQRLDFSEYVFINGGHTPWDHDSAALRIVIEQVIAFLDREVK